MLYLPASGRSPRYGRWGSEFPGVERETQPAPCSRCLTPGVSSRRVGALSALCAFWFEPPEQADGWVPLAGTSASLIITSAISEFVFFQPLLKKILTKDWILVTERPDSLASAVSQFSEHLQHMREPMGQVGGWSHAQAQWCSGGPTVICRLWSDLQAPFQWRVLFITVETADAGELSYYRTSS